MCSSVQTRNALTYLKWCLFHLSVVIFSEGSISPVPGSDNNGGTTINEILHETAKYDMKFSSLFLFGFDIFCVIIAVYTEYFLPS